MYTYITTHRLNCIRRYRHTIQLTFVVGLSNKKFFWLGVSQYKKLIMLQYKLAYILTIYQTLLRGDIMLRIKYKLMLCTRGQSTTMAEQELVAEVGYIGLLVQVIDLPFHPFHPGSFRRQASLLPHIDIVAAEHPTTIMSSCFSFDRKLSSLKKIAP